MTKNVGVNWKENFSIVVLENSGILREGRRPSQKQKRF